MEQIHGVLRKRLPAFRFRKVFPLLQYTGYSQPTDVNENQGRTQDHNKNRSLQKPQDSRDETLLKGEPGVADDPVKAPDLRNDEQGEVAPEPLTDLRIVAEAMDRLNWVPGQVILLHEGGTRRPIWLLKQRLIDVMNDMRDQTGVRKILEKESKALESKFQTGIERVETLVARCHNEDLTQEERNNFDEEVQRLEDRNDYVYAQRANNETAIRDIDSHQNTIYYKIFLSIQQALEGTGLLTPMPVINDDSEEEDEPPARIFRPASHKSSSVAVSNDELFRLAAVNKLEDLERALHRAESCFEDRNDAYNEHYEAWDRDMQCGNCSRTLTDVDLECVLEISKRARQLKEAEEEYEAAVVTARRLKVLPIQYDQESNFVSGPDDGYRESAEAELSATVDRKFIQRWTDQVAKLADLGVHASRVAKAESDDEAAPLTDEWDERGADAWEARSVGMSDSVSVVDCSRNRKRIDAWRKIAGW